MPSITHFKLLWIIFFFNKTVVRVFLSYSVSPWLNLSAMFIENKVAILVIDISLHFFSQCYFSRKFMNWIDFLLNGCRWSEALCHFSIESFMEFSHFMTILKSTFLKLISILYNIWGCWCSKCNIHVPLPSL